MLLPHLTTSTWLNKTKIKQNKKRSILRLEQSFKQLQLLGPEHCMLFSLDVTLKWDIYTEGHGGETDTPSAFILFTSFNLVVGMLHCLSFCSYIALNYNAGIPLILRRGQVITTELNYKSGNSILSVVSPQVF